MATYIVIGLVSGVVYGLAALGLVLIYKGSRLFNFAQGEFGTVAMYTMYVLIVLNKWSYIASVPVALAVGIALGLLTERLVARPLANSARVIGLVGTAGAALLMIGTQLVVAGPLPHNVPGALQGAGVTVAGFRISEQSLLAMAVLAVVALAAAYFFRRTFLGLAILANSQDPVAAKVVGANPNRISQLTWGIAGFLGALTGVVLGPSVDFYPGFMTTIILIPAFTAGIVGGMTSLIGAFVAGQIIGLVEAIGGYMVAKELPIVSEIPEFPTVLVFILLIITLLVRPRGLFGQEA